MRERTNYPPSATERRFASGLIAPPCFGGVARKMYRDGHADLFVAMPALDGPIMRRLQILVSDQLAAGITDLVLDCAGVDASDVTDVGLGLLVKLANELDRRPRRGTVTASICSDELRDRLDRLGVRNLIALAFPSTPHSAEAYG